MNYNKIGLKLCFIVFLLVIAFIREEVAYAEATYSGAFREYAIFNFEEGAKYSELISRVDSEDIINFLPLWKKRFQVINGFDDVNFEDNIIFYKINSREYNSNKGTIVLIIKYKVKYEWFTTTYPRQDSFLIRAPNIASPSESDHIEINDKGMCINEECVKKMYLPLSFVQSILSKPLIFHDEVSATDKLREKLDYQTITPNRIFYTVKDGIATIQGSVDINEGEQKCRIAVMDLSTGDIKITTDRYGCPYHE